MPKAYPHLWRTLLGAFLATLLCAFVLWLGFGLWELGSSLFIKKAEKDRQSVVFNVDFSTAKKDASPPQSTEIALTFKEFQQSSLTETKQNFNTRLFEYASSYALREALYFDVYPYMDYAKNQLFAQRSVDYALLQAFEHLGITQDKLFVAGLEKREHKGQPYFFQRVYVHTDNALDAVLEQAQKELKKWTQGTEIALQNRHILTLHTDNVLTHILYIVPKDRPFSLPPPKDAARISIVIDDLGENVRDVRALLALNIPMTFAIWPNASYRERSAELAHNAGHEVIVHQPMEPMGYPKVDPGSRAIFTNMNRQALEKVLLNNAARVPFSIGFNNHTGSAFTTNAWSVSMLVDILGSRGSMMLDSLTHPRSVFAKKAAEEGFNVGRREIFLDDGKDKRTALQNLYLAERLAKRVGHVIVIGHPMRETLQALNTWAKDRDKSVHVVPLRYQRPYRNRR